MINKVKEIIESNEAKTVINGVKTVLDVAGKTLYCFCKSISDIVKNNK